jgi:hypothetical protein
LRTSGPRPLPAPLLLTEAVTTMLEEQAHHYGRRAVRLHRPYRCWWAICRLVNASDFTKIQLFIVVFIWLCDETSCNWSTVCVYMNSLCNCNRIEVIYIYIYIVGLIGPWAI